MIKIGSYDYKGLIKSYLAQGRPSANTADKRMSYKGLNLFSYNSLLATISITRPNTLYINKSISKCSITTIKQTNKLHKEALLNWNIFTIDFGMSHKENLSLYWSEVELLITRYKRARTLKPTIKQSIHKAVSHAQHFAEWHELDPTIPDLIMRHLFVNQLLK